MPQTRKNKIQVPLNSDAYNLVPDLTTMRSEEHTSELQSRRDLVCRLLLEKKNNPEADVIIGAEPLLVVQYRHGIGAQNGAVTRQRLFRRGRLAQRSDRRGRSGCLLWQLLA